MRCLRYTRIWWSILVNSWTWEKEEPICSPENRSWRNSSTEADIDGVDDVMTQVIWTRYFLKEQGINIHGNIIYQYNQSAIKLEENGRQWIRKRKRNINIRYYLLLMGSRSKRHLWNYFPPWTWLGITSQTHYGVINSLLPQHHSWYPWGLHPSLHRSWKSFDWIKK